MESKISKQRICRLQKIRLAILDKGAKIDDYVGAWRLDILVEGKEIALVLYAHRPICIAITFNGEWQKYIKYGELIKYHNELNKLCNLHKILSEDNYYDKKEK